MNPARVSTLSDATCDIDVTIDSRDPRLRATVDTGVAGVADDRAATDGSGAIVAVAYSGGRDSTALLHAALRAAAPLGGRVVALHVHHGLSPQANGWVDHCERQVRLWQGEGLPVNLAVNRLTVSPSPGDSVEAWAREARYRALADMAAAHRTDLVLLAHHRRDQAETFLLQALRGAGVAGLAAMPQRMVRDGVVWLRPWLDRPREEIEAYLLANGLTYIDDDSNQQPRYARNRLRLDIWPALSGAFPQAEGSLADAARWSQQADAALRELAAIDLAALWVGRSVDGPDADQELGLGRTGEGESENGRAADRTVQHSGSGLNVSAWLGLSEARRSNALRAWLHAGQDRPAPSSLVIRLLTELPRAATGRWSVPNVPNRWLELRRGRLGWVDAAPRSSPQLLDASAGLQDHLAVRRAGSYSLAGWGGRLCIRRAREGGVPFAWLADLALKPRVGGEQFQAGIGRPARSLKKQYQAADVSAGSRCGPLVYSGDRLLFVPGLGIDARAVAAAGVPQARIDWLPNAKAAEA